MRASAIWLALPSLAVLAACSLAPYSPPPLTLTLPKPSGFSTQSLATAYPAVDCFFVDEATDSPLGKDVPPLYPDGPMSSLSLGRVSNLASATNLDASSAVISFSVPRASQKSLRIMGIGGAASVGTNGNREILDCDGKDLQKFLETAPSFPNFYQISDPLVVDLNSSAEALQPTMAQDFSTSLNNSNGNTLAVKFSSSGLVTAIFATTDPTFSSNTVNSSVTAATSADSGFLKSPRNAEVAFLVPESSFPKNAGFTRMQIRAVLRGGLSADCSSDNLQSGAILAGLWQEKASIWLVQSFNSDANGNSAATFNTGTNLDNLLTDVSVGGVVGKYLYISFRTNVAAPADQCSRLNVEGVEISLIP